MVAIFLLLTIIEIELLVRFVLGWEGTSTLLILGGHQQPIADQGGGWPPSGQSPLPVEVPTSNPEVPPAVLSAPPQSWGAPAIAPHSRPARAILGRTRAPLRVAYVSVYVMACTRKGSPSQILRSYELKQRQDKYEKRHILSHSGEWVLLILIKNGGRIAKQCTFWRQNLEEI